MFNLFVACFLAGVGLGSGVTIICAVIMSMTNTKASKRRAFIERTAPRLLERGPVEMADGTVYFPASCGNAQAAVDAAASLWDEIEEGEI